MPLFVPKDRKSLFRQFLAGMYDAVVITDPNGHILEVNRRAVEHFGYNEDEVVFKYYQSSDVNSADEFYSAMEREILEKVNALDIGPQGFGGKTTALAVHIEQCPTHIAGLPVAVNINCHVTRHKTEVL